MAEHLTVEDILTSEDLDFEDAPVPEWSKNSEPKVIRIREMSADRLLAFNEEMDKPDSRRNGIFIILVFTATDVDDNLLFTVEQIAALRKKNFKVLDRLQRVALRINKLGKQQETLLKNDLSEAVIAASPSV